MSAVEMVLRYNTLQAVEESHASSNIESKAQSLCGVHHDTRAFVQQSVQGSPRHHLLIWELFEGQHLLIWELFEGQHLLIWELFEGQHLLIWELFEGQHLLIWELFEGQHLLIWELFEGQHLLIWELFEGQHLLIWELFEGQHLLIWELFEGQHLLIWELFEGQHLLIWELFEGQHLLIWELFEGQHLLIWELFEGQHLLIWELFEGQHLLIWELFEGQHLLIWELFEGQHLLIWELFEGQHFLPPQLFESQQNLFGNSSLKSREILEVQSLIASIFATTSFFCQRPRQVSPEGVVAIFVCRDRKEQELYFQRIHCKSERKNFNIFKITLDQEVQIAESDVPDGVAGSSLEERELKWCLLALLTYLQLHIREVIKVGGIVNRSYFHRNGRGALPYVIPVHTAEERGQLEFVHATLRAESPLCLATEPNDSFLCLFRDGHLWGKSESFAPVHNLAICLLGVLTTEWRGCEKWLLDMDKRLDSSEEMTKPMGYSQQIGQWVKSAAITGEASFSPPNSCAEQQTYR
uniref:Uncharacterized protein n=1 Tax=Timema bartmani TaxID=61472 RepID=A0A7R9I0D4_9NEOP|nr:unnamed protein product [Timema bartmani]